MFYICIVVHKNNPHGTHKYNKINLMQYIMSMFSKKQEQKQGQGSRTEYELWLRDMAAKSIESLKTEYRWLIIDAKMAGTTTGLELIRSKIRDLEYIIDRREFEERKSDLDIRRRCLNIAARINEKTANGSGDIMEYAKAIHAWFTQSSK